MVEGSQFTMAQMLTFPMKSRLGLRTVDGKRERKTEGTLNSRVRAIRTLARGSIHRNDFGGPCLFVSKRNIRPQKALFLTNML
jgi:hypothetical protein